MQYTLEVQRKITLAQKVMKNMNMVTCKQVVKECIGFEGKYSLMRYIKLRYISFTNFS